MYTNRKGTNKQMQKTEFFMLVVVFRGLYVPKNLNNAIKLTPFKIKILALRVKKIKIGHFVCDLGSILCKYLGKSNLTFEHQQKNYK